MKIFITIFFVLSANIVIAQRTLSGVITDKSNQPIRNVKVTVKCSNLKTVSDDHGRYFIDIPEDCRTIEFSKEGFQVQVAEVNSDEVNMSMKALADVDVFDLSLEELLDVQVVSIASTKATTVFNTPSTVSIIDAQMLQRYNFSSVSDALRVVSGISILQTSSRKQIPTSRSILQDHYPNKVLVMINGIAQWNPITGETGSLNRVSISDVERIEILKGPASVSYGTNAFTGAINIVLKNNQGNDNGQFFATIGDKKTISSGLNILRRKEAFSLFVSANTQREGGDNRHIVDGDNVSGNFKDFINYNNLTTNLQYKKHSFTFNTYSEEQQKLGVDPYYYAALGKPQKLNGYLVNYSSSVKLSNKLNLLGGTGYDWQQRLFPRAQDLSVVTDMLGWRANAYFKLLYNINERFNVEFGSDFDYRKSDAYRNYDVLKDSILTESNLGGKSVYEFSSYGQVGYRISFVNLLYGMRYTKNQYFGNNLSHRGTLLLAINDKNSVKFIYGQSFRAPSMFEVYFINSSKTVSGNPDLKPEKSNSYEVSYQILLGNFYLQSLLYYAEYDNKIFRVTQPFCVLPDGGIGTAKTKKYTNGGKFNATGVEIESKYSIKDFNAFLNYNYVAGNKGDTIGANDVYNFKYIPHHTLSGGFYISVKNFSFSNVSSYMSKAIGGLSQDVSAQFTSDVSFGMNHKVGGSLIKHTVSVKNLFDTKLVTPEYVDRTFNEIPLWNQRRFLYTMTISF